jgi:hypothetical protein
MRSRYSVATLGYSFVIAAQDIFNPVQAFTLGNISTGGLVHAAINALPFVTYRGARETATKMSPEIRHRAGEGMAALRRHFLDMGGVGKNPKWSKFQRWMNDMSFALIAKTDEMTSTAIWTAAMHDAVNNMGLTSEEAVVHADDVLHSSMPSWDIADQPSVLADRQTMASFIQFFSFFSAQGNQFSRLIDERGAGEAFARIFATIVVSNVICELIAGRGPEPDEEIPEWMLRKVLAAPANVVPLMGAPAELVLGYVISAMWHGKGKVRGVSFRTSPALSMLDRIGRTVNTMKKEGTDESHEKAFAALDAIGLLSGTPVGTNQIQKTGKFIASPQGLQQDVRRGNVADVASGLYRGKRAGQGADIFTPFTKNRPK